MEKVTVTIEGTAEEINSAVKRLAGMVPEAQAVQEKPPSNAWSDDEIEVFFGGLKSNAQSILREIAKRPDGYPRGSLLTNLEMSGRTVGGSLSSVGHNRRRLFPKKPRPVRLVNNDYQMLPEFAEWVGNRRQDR